MLQEYMDLSVAFDFFHFESLVFLAVIALLLYLGKLLHDLLTPFNIDKELTTNDNKAIAVSYAGYIVAQAIIIHGVVSGEETTFVNDLLMTGFWSLLGMILLNIAGLLNDKIILGTFHNSKELVEDRNIGVGAVQAGSFIGAAFVLDGILMGTTHNFLQDLVGTAVFFIVGQLGFILFGLLYTRVSGFDLHAQIEKDNASAGVAFGATLAAIGVIMSHPISLTFSLPAFAIWWVNGAALLIICRVIVDKILLPGHKLSDEISNDHNWGVALIEGFSALLLAFLIKAAF